LSEAFRSSGYRHADAAFEHGLEVLVVGTEAILTEQATP
jgi:hypothetical protein